MSTIISDGISTVVDHTNYDLSFHAAIQELLVGKNIIAQPFPDFTSDDIGDHCPSPLLLEAKDFRNQSYQEIGDYLSQYENFGRS